MGVAEIYYGLWTMMLEWPIAARAAIVIGFWMAVVYLFMPALMKLFSRLILILDIIIKYIIYPVCNVCVELVMKKSSLISRAEALNKLSHTMSRLSERLKARAEKISCLKRVSIIKIVIAYAILIFLIGLPGVLENKIAPAYLPFFSAARNTYHNLEKNTLSIAEKYPPLFVTNNDKKETKIKSEQTETEPENSDSKTENEIWLSLSEKGREGAYIRKKPSKSSDSITVIYRDEKMVFLKKKNGWVQVRLEDGGKGWIGESLVVGVPEDG